MTEGRSLVRPYVTRGDLKFHFLIRSDPVLLCKLSLFHRYTVITTDLFTDMARGGRGAERSWEIWWKCGVTKR